MRSTQENVVLVTIRLFAGSKGASGATIQGAVVPEPGFFGCQGKTAAPEQKMNSGQPGPCEG